MATALYPGEFPGRALRTFINDPSLSEYAQKAEKLLEALPAVFIPRVQYKRPGVKNTCWYVALKEEPDVWLVNFTIVPSELNIELRDEVKRRDEYKKQWCQERGIKLMHIEWEGYMKTIYRLPEATRRERFGWLVKRFLSQNALFVEATESYFRDIA